MAGLLLLLLVGPLIAWRLDLFGGRPRYTGLLETVTLQKLVMRVVERGELEAAENADILSRVKFVSTAGKGTIQHVVDDGSIVKKGDVLVRLDSTTLENDLLMQQIVVETKKAEWITAEEAYKIQLSQNETDILKAKTDLDLAILDLEKYEEGDYHVAKNDIEKKVEKALSDHGLWTDKANWSKRMAIKGYISKSQVESDVASLATAELELKNAKKELEVLEAFTKLRTIQDLKSKKIQAQQALERAVIQAKAKEVQTDTDRKTKKSTYDQELAKKQELEEDIAHCTLRAPKDGLIVYYTPPQSRWGRGSQQSVIAPGEPVSYNQKLLQIPTLSRMHVKTRVHEAMVSYLRDTGSDHSAQSQPAYVRIEAYPDKIFPAHVISVATIASQQDFFSSDVKVYETILAIDKEVSQLKPGMSAEVTIVAYESPQPVLTIPIHAVVGSITMGRKRKCFVVDKDGYAEQRDIVLGMTNATVVEVKSGLKEGEQVAADPSLLLSADSPLTPSQPAKSKSRGINPGETPGGTSEGHGGAEPKGDGAAPPGGPPKSGLPGKGGPGGEPTPEQKQQMMQRFTSASPAERRDMINAIPDPAARERVRGLMKAKGMEIAQ